MLSFHSKKSYTQKIKSSKMTKLLSLFLFGAVLTICNGQLIGKCGDDRSRAFDACGQRPMVMGMENSTFPRNANEARSYCKHSRESIACMRTFAKQCLSALPKQGTSLIAYGMNKNIKRVCKTAASRECKLYIFWPFFAEF